jgi:hypothetical protein
VRGQRSVDGLAQEHFDGPKQGVEPGRQLGVEQVQFERSPMASSRHGATEMPQSVTGQ